ncbi:hypothetical protein ABZ297_20630 [Nonomuraea sp. NPDC005983]|uniref:hypothetical protein n=1 Tax=Nonomuraea sp. NPDC005983 TaxID=3155595 RepID=UPI00339E5D49
MRPAQTADRAAVEQLVQAVFKLCWRRTNVKMASRPLQGRQAVSMRKELSR